MVPSRQDAAEKVTIGAKLQFQREADNPYDGAAVKLLYDDQMLGYVPAKHAVWVADIIDNDRPLNIIVRNIRAAGDARQPQLYLDTQILTDMDALQFPASACDPL